MGVGGGMTGGMMLEKRYWQYDSTHEREGCVKPMFESVHRKKYKDIKESERINYTILKSQRGEESKYK